MPTCKLTSTVELSRFGTAWIHHPDLARLAPESVSQCIAPKQNTRKSGKPKNQTGSPPGGKGPSDHALGGKNSGKRRKTRRSARRRRKPEAKESESDHRAVLNTPKPPITDGQVVSKDNHHDRKMAGKRRDQRRRPRAKTDVCIPADQPACPKALACDKLRNHFHPRSARQGAPRRLLEKRDRKRQRGKRWLMKCKNGEDCKEPEHYHYHRHKQRGGGREPLIPLDTDSESYFQSWCCAKNNGFTSTIADPLSSGDEGDVSDVEGSAVELQHHRDCKEAERVVVVAEHDHIDIAQPPAGTPAVVEAPPPADPVVYDIDRFLQGLPPVVEAEAGDEAEGHHPAGHDLQELEDAKAEVPARQQALAKVETPEPSAPPHPEELKDAQAEAPGMGQVPPSLPSNLAEAWKLSKKHQGEKKDDVLPSPAPLRVSRTLPIRRRLSESSSWSESFLDEERCQEWVYKAVRVDLFVNSSHYDQRDVDRVAGVQKKNIFERFGWYIARIAFGKEEAIQIAPGHDGARMPLVGAVQTVNHSWRSKGRARAGRGRAKDNPLCGNFITRFWDARAENVEVCQNILDWLGTRNIPHDPLTRDGEIVNTYASTILFELKKHPDFKRMETESRSSVFPKQFFMGRTIAYFVGRRILEFATIQSINSSGAKLPNRSTVPQKDASSGENLSGSGR